MAGFAYICFVFAASIVGALLVGLGHFWRAHATMFAEDLSLGEPLDTLTRDNYQFDTIYTASFSNGWYAHSAFQGKAVGASSMTRYLFDLDGRAAKPSSIQVTAKRPPSRAVRPRS